jgi:hypothetical protein
MKIQLTLSLLYARRSLKNICMKVSLGCILIRVKSVTISALPRTESRAVGRVGGGGGGGGRGRGGGAGGGGGG